MEYRAVANRCAVDLDSLRLPLSRAQVMAALSRTGFTVVTVDMIALARQCIGKSQYRRCAHLSQAPGVVDCSGFMKWLYGELGIWLPRRAIQQHECGEVVTLDALAPGDLVFASGARNHYHETHTNGICHVGMVTADGTVIDASFQGSTVAECPLEKFIGGKKAKFRGARRYVPTGKKILTLEVPPNLEVETADDIRWIILQSLPQQAGSPNPGSA